MKQTAKHTTKYKGYQIAQSIIKSFILIFICYTGIPARGESGMLSCAILNMLKYVIETDTDSICNSLIIRPRLWRAL